MKNELYDLFANDKFDQKTCFLTGNEITVDEQINVFPEWLMEVFDLKDKPFKLLDESLMTYQDIKLPCSFEAAAKLQDLEKSIEKAFLAGYEEVNNLDGKLIFLWVGKLVFGTIYHEIQYALKKQHTGGDAFQLSLALKQKFKNLHIMLQTLVKPIVFENFKPYSLFLFKVDNAKDEFSYRDEVNTLTFSLRIKDFGLIVCLQDNGVNKNYHQKAFDLVADKTLHPIQFEECCAHVFYSAYLLNRLPDYHILPTEDAIFIEAMPLKGMSSKPIFDDWQNKIYAQVLENFWKRWDILSLQILKDPEIPMSYLFDENREFKVVLDLPN